MATNPALAIEGVSPIRKIKKKRTKSEAKRLKFLEIFLVRRLVLVMRMERWVPEATMIWVRPIRERAERRSGLILDLMPRR